MIRIVPLGVVFLVGLSAIAVMLGVVWLAPGLGAVAAATKKSTLPSPEIVVPTVAGIEADRLPIRISEDTLTNADKVDIAYVTPTEQANAAKEKSKNRSTDTPQRQVIDVTECRFDELAPLLGRLNLSPPCVY